MVWWMRWVCTLWTFLTEVRHQGPVIWRPYLVLVLYRPAASRLVMMALTKGSRQPCMTLMTLEIDADLRYSHCCVLYWWVHLWCRAPTKLNIDGTTDSEDQCGRITVKLSALSFPNNSLLSGGDPESDSVNEINQEKKSTNRKWTCQTPCLLTTNRISTAAVALFTSLMLLVYLSPLFVFEYVVARRYRGPAVSCVCM